MKKLYFLYQWLIFMPLFLVITIITAIVTTVGCMGGYNRTFGYYPGKIWSCVTCYLALCPVKVKGREHIKKGESYVFVANHQGAFDVFLIYGFLGVPVKWMMKKSLRNIPFVGKACESAGFIFVDNTSPLTAARSIRQAEASFQNGLSLAIFPEGSRTYDGKMIKFKKGAFQIATDLHLPIVPVTLNGPYDVLPIHGKKLSPSRLEMIIHEPIPTQDLRTNQATLTALADESEQIVASGLWEKYRDYPAEESELPLTLQEAVAE